MVRLLKHQELLERLPGIGMNRVRGWMAPFMLWRYLLIVGVCNYLKRAESS